MLAPPGYTLAKSLHETPHTALYGAVCETDGRQVVLKSYGGGEARRRAERERDALRRSVGPGVVGVLALHLDGELPLRRSR